MHLYLASLAALVDELLLRQLRGTPAGARHRAAR